MQACAFRDGIADFERIGARVYGFSNDGAEANGAFKEKFRFPYDLLCDTTTEISKALGAFGEQEWKGKKYDGLTRTTIVVDANGAIAGVLQGIKPEEHAAQALKLLGG